MAIGPAAVLAVGMALVWQALPRTVAHANMAMDHRVMESLARGSQAAPGDLFTAIARHEDALRWFDLADGWTDIGALYLALARRSGQDPRQRAALLDRSILAFGHGLALAPVRPYGWVQLAQARHMRYPGSPDAAAAAMRLSYATGPMEARLVTQRVRIGFAARGALPSDLTDRIHRDVRLWADHDPRRLAAWARAHYALPWVRTVLAGDAALDRRFVTNYLRLPPR